MYFVLHCVDTLCRSWLVAYDRLTLRSPARIDFLSGAVLAAGLTTSLTSEWTSERPFNQDKFDQLYIFKQSQPAPLTLPTGQ